MSLALLAVLFTLVVTALVVEGNRSKAMRVGPAAAAYLSGLVVWGLSRRRVPDTANRVPVTPFILSGCGAGLVSGLARSDASLAVVVVQVAGAGPLLGGFHWFAIRMWRRVFERIVGSHGA